MQRKNWTGKSAFEVDEVVQWRSILLLSHQRQRAGITSIIRLDTGALESLNGVQQIKFDYRVCGKPPFGRITLSSKHGGKIKCVYVSTILGAMRTAKAF